MAARKASPRRPRTREANLQRLERAADLYLHACYASQTAARVAEFAAFIRITRPHLSRLVLQLVGKSVRDYLRMKQLEYAQQLLRTTPLPVDTIARASAFGTPWTFNRCFRAAFGETPAEFRRNVTK